MRRLTMAATLALLLPAGLSGQDFDPDSAWLAVRGFWQRAPDALLHADADSIRELGSRRLSGILDALDRIETRVLEGNRYLVLHSSDQWESDPEDAPCVLAIYLNGGRLIESRGGTATMATADRTIDVRALQGIELYPAITSPVGDGTCGAVLAWSRRMVSRVDEDFVGHFRGRAMRVPEGVPAGGIDIVLEPGGRSQKTSSAGWFDFGAVLPGRYTITASAGEASWTGDVVVRAFAISQIVIEVERTGARHYP